MIRMAHLLGLGLFFAQSAAALTTAYVSFEHPERWRCELSQGVWICQSTVEPDRKESVVLSIATMRTEWDSLDNYLSYLKRPRTIQDEEGNTITSKVTYARKRTINGVTWVDSLQKNSELPGFWARYVATVQGKLAILITYIVSEANYKKLAPQFERMVASLKPNAEFDLNIASNQSLGPIPGSEILGKRKKNILRNRLNLGRKKTADVKPLAKAPAGEGGGLDPTLLAVGVGAAALYFLMRKRRKAKEAKKKARKTPRPPTRRRTG